MNPSRPDLLLALYDRLLQTLGPQYWWPADTAFEVVVGAILTQNTAWRNVKLSIALLKENGLLSQEPLRVIPEAELALIIRSSGYYNQKARRLKAFFDHLDHDWRGDLNRFLAQEMDDLRSELLGMHGIGPETADSIVLYAAAQPSFVVDAYTLRIFSRHGWVPEKTRYEELRRFFMEALPPDVPLFKEYHGLLVRLGHRYCRKKPLCNGCPLEPWLVAPNKESEVDFTECLS